MICVYLLQSNDNTSSRSIPIYRGSGPEFIPFSSDAEEKRANGRDRTVRHERPDIKKRTGIPSRPHGVPSGSDAALLFHRLRFGQYRLKPQPFVHPVVFDIDGIEIVQSEDYAQFTRRKPLLMKLIQQSIVFGDARLIRNKTIRGVLDHMVTKQFFDRHLGLEQSQQLLRTMAVCIDQIHQYSDIIEARNGCIARSLQAAFVRNNSTSVNGVPLFMAIGS